MQSGCLSWTGKKDGDWNMSEELFLDTTRNKSSMSAAQQQQQLPFVSFSMASIHPQH